MVDSSQGGETPKGGGPRVPRPLPMAALAGAVVLVGLVGFALFRRHAASPEGPGAPPVAGADAAETAGDTSPSGGMVTATVPIRMTPEGRILAERYRCVCGCNDALSVCTCQNDPGSEVMKRFLQAQVDEKKGPEEVDRAMVERYGPACLLTNPAPPQSMPSHAGAPPAGAEKRPRSPG